MREFFDGLDAGGVPRKERSRRRARPEDARPAAERSLGTHPYFTTPEHTAFARERVGPGVLVAPELAVVVETDPEVARGAAREYAETYLRLRNYTNNLLRFGFTEDDIANGGSDRLIDAVIPHGSAGGDRRGRPRPPRRRRRPRLPPAARARPGADRGLPRAGDDLEHLIRVGPGGPFRQATRRGGRSRGRRGWRSAGGTPPRAARTSSTRRAEVADLGAGELVVDDAEQHPADEHGGADEPRGGGGAPRGRGRARPG